MLHQTPKSQIPIVKLFPRLAPAIVATKVRVERKRPQGHERTQVRARLLRMIIDNERSRRNDQRPNAS